jgi:tetratricopeptide (TPR) repeat protein
MNARMQEAYRSATNFNFERCDSLLSRERRSNPKNIAPEYVSSYKDFLLVFITEEEQLFEDQKDRLSDRQKRMEEIPEESPWHKYAEAEVLIHTALTKLKFKEYFTAGYQLRKAYKLIEENCEVFPEFIPQYPAMGFFHAAISTIPENYMWIARLAGFEGTIEEGTAEMDKALKSARQHDNLRYLFGTSMTLRIIAALNFERNVQEAEDLIRKIDDSFNGPLRTFLVANTLLYNDTPGDELEYLRTRDMEPEGTQPLHYLYYMRGISYLNKLELSPARADLTRFIDNYKGTSFRNSTWQKLAWINLLEGDEQGYRESISNAGTGPEPFTDEDKQAYREYELGEAPNPVLLRSRVLFDGRDYTGALNEIAGKPLEMFPSVRDKIELTYRFARISEMTGDHDKALKFYSKTISTGSSTRYYYAANSALHSGYIHESRGDTAKAIEKYRLCLKMRGHDYQNSIDQKAKAGLSRLH